VLDPIIARKEAENFCDQLALSHSSLVLEPKASLSEEEELEKALATLSWLLAFLWRPEPFELSCRLLDVEPLRSMLLTRRLRRLQGVVLVIASALTIFLSCQGKCSHPRKVS
jgi:hypothetical protein